MTALVAAAIAPTLVAAQVVTWIGGNTTLTPVWGSKGVASAVAWPPQLQRHAMAADLAGNVWVFGGMAGGSNKLWTGTAYACDLWKYTPATGMWTWASGSKLLNDPGVTDTVGVASATAYPGGRAGPMMWCDAGGSVYVFGGGAMTNDLWRFSPADAKWTLLSGTTDGSQASTGVYSGNAPTPGGRSAAAVCSNRGLTQTFVFGGWGYDSTGAFGTNNDMWMFDSTSAGWTWLAGNSTCRNQGSYRGLGSGSAGAYPAARHSAACWVDGAGTSVYVFGGFVIGSSRPSSGLVNDFWRFDLKASTWTWMAGTNTPGGVGTPGTLAVASTSNLPGARMAASSWASDTGDMYIMGGISPTGYFSDLWRFRPATAEWTRLADNGQTTTGSVALGVPADASRMHSTMHQTAAFSAADRRVYLFGGTLFWQTQNEPASALFVLDASATLPQGSATAAATATATSDSGSLSTPKTSASVSPRVSVWTLILPVIVPLLTALGIV
ncbi:hypothetical protein HK105_205239 [Polyrhizophydium stewartii]|uniref:Galactose oxidase n=1 Tax=Polyrhizophydium stewartii TaxID=2732419 RepID=A0ABR4N6N3_9FUNG